MPEGKKKILLVDDSKTALMVFSMMLSAGSYQLITAADGEEDVSKALAERPDLIILDVMMPKLNGIEACRKLRKNKAMRDVPIIMVTTRGDVDSMEKAFEAGCSDYMTKPVTAIELLSKVHNYIGR